MFKNKKKNQYGTFLVGKAGYKKISQYFVATLTVVIFVFGIGSLIINHAKTKKVSQNVVASIPSTIPGWWLQKYFGSSTCDRPDYCGPNADPDHDGLTNAQEFYYHTDPLQAYTVGDSMNDGQLVAAGFDPSRKGHMTFDQVVSPDNILGESLLVGQDFKNIVAQQNDINKVPLPLATNDQLNVIPDDSQKVYETYFSTIQTTINRYFTQDELTSISQTLKASSNSDLDSIKTKAGLLTNDLRAVTVPQRMLMYHKYLLAFFDLMPKVLLSNGDPALNSSSTESDVWYQNAQALFVTVQKLSTEAKRINQPAPVNP
jgi:hypothetical protein